MGIGQCLLGAWWKVSFTYFVCPKFLALCWVPEAHFLVFPLHNNHAGSDVAILEMRQLRLRKLPWPKRGQSSAIGMWAPVLTFSVYQTTRPRLCGGESPWNLGWVMSIPGAVGDVGRALRAPGTRGFSQGLTVSC